VGNEGKSEKRYSFILAKELKRKGYPLHYVVRFGSPLHHEASGAGFSVFPLKFSHGIGVASKIRLYRALKQKNCCLVHFHDDRSLAAGSAAVSWAKIQLRIISRPVTFPLKNQAVFRRKYTKGVDAVLANSDKGRKDLEKVGIDARLIKEIPAGIDFSSYGRENHSDYLHQELLFAPDDYLVGIMADFSDDKKCAYMFRLVQHLKEHTTKIRVIILGKGPIRIQRGKRTDPTEDLAFFMGFEERMPQILQSLDVFVFSPYQESKKSLLLYAMASRLPVIVPRMEGIPEVVRHRKTGLLVSPRSARFLAEAIIRLYEGQEWASSLGQKARQTVYERFSVEAMADKVIDLYETLAQKKGIRLRRFA
jgi:glycosyltransferase involved in cell wall biosynthesis